MAKDMTGDVVFTDAQNRFLSSLPRIWGPFSMLGSLLIIYIILRDRRKLLKNSYDRIMLGLSTMDMLSSLSLTLFGPWSIPEEVPFVVGAQASSPLPCDISGFLAHCTFGTILYTSSLMILFVLQVRLEWRPERISRYVEPWLHGISIGFTLATGLTALVMGYFNAFAALPGLCWITAYPPTCEFRNDEECLRGEGSLTFVRAIAFFPLLTVVIVIGAMVLLILQVRATEQRLARYQVGDAPVSFERTRRTCKRGLAYIFAFFVSYAPPAIIVLVLTNRAINSRSAFFFSSLLIAFSFPLQGVFNAIIYIRPKWKELKHQRDFHWLSVLLSCLGGSHDSNNRSKKDIWMALCGCCRRSRSSRPPQDQTWPGADLSLEGTRAPTITNDPEQHSLAKHNFPEHEGEDESPSRQHNVASNNDPKQQEEEALTTAADPLQQHDIVTKNGTMQQDGDAPTTAGPSQKHVFVNNNDSDRQEVDDPTATTNLSQQYDVGNSNGPEQLGEDAPTVTGPHNKATL